MLERLLGLKRIWHRDYDQPGEVYIAQPGWYYHPIAKPLQHGGWFFFLPSNLVATSRWWWRFVVVIPKSRGWRWG